MQFETAKTIHGRKTNRSFLHSTCFDQRMLNDEYKLVHLRGVKWIQNNSYPCNRHRYEVDTYLENILNSTDDVYFAREGQHHR